VSLKQTPHPSSRSRKFVVRRAAAILVVVFSIGLLSAGWSLANAVFTPVNDPASAKIAEWARGHGMGSLVTGLESLQYRLNPPKVGGMPTTSLLQSSTQSENWNSSSERLLQSTLPTLVTPSLPNEGKFKSIVTSHGIPLVQVAYMRPDALHTSYLSAVVWMSGKYTRLVQHPGQSDPGHLSLWSQKTSIADSNTSGLVAAFNGGFKIKDSRGGYYENDHTAGKLAPGAASLVLYRNGKTNIGAWGTDVTMTPEVVSVRQNLQLLIENGKLATNLDAAVKANWGTTVGASTNVWRSGIGITATGNLVYVAGDALSAHSLAALLARAGSVRAMQLDINKSWISYMWYTPRVGSTLLTPHKILNFQRPANRYFSTTSRDFFAVYYK
jgi:hypothetical protein